MFWNRGEHCWTLGAGEKPENKKQDSLSKHMLWFRENLQFVFKGLIIIAAVALDSVKYLKRK